MNPLDELSVKELRKELTIRGEHIGTKLKPQLTVQFETRYQQCTCFATANTSSSFIEDLYLEKYEISPVEPLHDIKGHIANLIEEAITIGKCSAKAN